MMCSVFGIAQDSPERNEKSGNLPGPLCLRGRGELGAAEAAFVMSKSAPPKGALPFQLNNIGLSCATSVRNGAAGWALVLCCIFAEPGEKSGPKDGWR